jgi:hypothetical protein
MLDLNNIGDPSLDVYACSGGSNDSFMLASDRRSFVYFISVDVMTDLEENDVLELVWG